MPAVTPDELKTALTCAVERFNRGADRDTLLCPREPNIKRGESGWQAASERAIAYRLAFYLESELRRLGLITDNAESLTVDCEYNRHLKQPKALRAEQELKSIVEQARRTATDDPDDDRFFSFSIAPDIIVHRRFFDHLNLLVVELKKETNTEPPSYDALKLSIFTSPPPEGYGYLVGARVIALDDRAQADRKLEIRWTWDEDLAPLTVRPVLPARNAQGG